MKFDLKVEDEKNKAIELFQSMLHNECLIELSKKHANKSIPQNAYFHILCKYIALHQGEVYEYFKQEIVKKIIARDVFRMEYINANGESRVGWRSFSELDSKEVTIIIERMKAWASKELQIELPEPGNFDAIRRIENELEMNITYL